MNGKGRVRKDEWKRTADENYIQRMSWNKAIFSIWEKPKKNGQPDVPVNAN